MSQSTRYSPCSGRFPPCVPPPPTSSLFNRIEFCFQGRFVQEGFERNTKYPVNLPNNFFLTFLQSQQFQALVIFTESKWEQNSHLLIQ